MLVAKLVVTRKNNKNDILAILLEIDYGGRCTNESNPCSQKTTGAECIDVGDEGYMCQCNDTFYYTGSRCVESRNSIIYIYLILTIVMELNVTVCSFFIYLSVNICCVLK